MANVESYMCPKTGQECGRIDHCTLLSAFTDMTDLELAELARKTSDGIVADNIRSGCSDLVLDGLANLMQGTRESFIFYSAEDQISRVIQSRVQHSNPDITMT